MVDDGWMDADALRELLDVLRLQAEALAAMANREAGRPPPASGRADRRPHQPQNKAFRDWRRFRDHMQNLEQTVRLEHNMGPESRVTKEMIYAAGGPPAKTLTRIMTDTFGLAPTDWPPSTWPADLSTAA